MPFGVKFLMSLPPYGFIAVKWRKIMKIGSGFTILITLLLGSAVGCTRQPTRFDTFQGTAYELAKESQINNPDAGIHTGPALGLDGAISSKIIDRYEKGFEKPVLKTESYSINVGGMTKK
jgi:hypothetical protein